MTETKDTTDKTLRGERAQAAEPEADGRSRPRAAELQPWPLEVGGRREEEEAHDLRHPAAPRREERRRRAEAERLRGRGACSGLAASPPTSSMRAARALEAAKERAEARGASSAHACEALRPPQARAERRARGSRAAPLTPAPHAEAEPRGAGRSAPAADAEARRTPPRRPRCAARRRQPRETEIAKRGEPVGKLERRGRGRDDEDDRAPRRRAPSRAKSPVKLGDERRERVKLTINNAFDEAQRERSLASLKRKREREKLRQAGIAAAAREDHARGDHPRGRSPSRSSPTA